MFNIDYTFQWSGALNALPEMLKGALVTLEIAATSMILGVIIALILTFMRRSHNFFVHGIASMWVSIARNTPSLLQIYFIYFGLGSLGIIVNSWIALVIAITFNNAGYLAENFRGGLKAIPDTQVRAARSLGMSAFQSYIHIVIPQLLRVVFYPLTNQMVWAILMTSLGSVVGVNNDLMGVTDDVANKLYRMFELFFIAAVIYYLLAKILVLIARLASWRLFRY